MIASRRAIPARQAIFLAAVVIAALAACRGGQRGPGQQRHGHTEPQRGGVLRTTMNGAIATLDPAIAYDENSGYAVHHMYDTLLGYGSSNQGKGTELVPHLAESWSVTDDGKRYSFVLRDGLRYSDGSPCVAGDFKYSFERTIGHAKSPFKEFLLKIVGGEALAEGAATELTGVRVSGTRELEIELVEPDGSFAMILAMAFTTPLSRTHVEAVGDELRRKPLGMGPFMLDRWDEGSQIILARNPHHWNPERPRLDGLTFFTVVSRETGFLKFEAGELDTVARLSSADFLWLSQRADWQPYLQKIPSMAPVGARMNCQKPPFNDVRVRRALNYAVNKSNLRKLLSGRTEIAAGLLPPTMFGHNPELEPYPHDPDRARRLLAEAGVADGLTLQYTIFQDSDNELVAQSMQADLRKVGIEMTINVLTFPAFLDAVGRPDGAPFSFMGWQVDYPDPSALTDVLFHSSRISEQASSNNVFYANPELDRMLDAARDESDLETRRELYEEIDAFLYHEAPWIWLFNMAPTDVRQPYVIDYKPHPVWTRDFSEAWLDVPPDRLRRGS